MTSFGQQLRTFEAKTLQKMETAVRKIVLDAFSEVIAMSPVDTGRFRGNWQIAVGSAPTGTVELLDPSGAIVTARVAVVAGEVKAGDVIYMVNNLPYAQRLEDGYSQQAPAGMVRLTVQRWQPIVDAVIKQIVSGAG
jgi:hypothetical protein